MKKARGRSGFFGGMHSTSSNFIFCVYDIAYLKCIPDVVI